MAAIAQWLSVGLMIERLLSSGSILELAMRRCVFRKDTLRFIPIEAKQSTHYGGPS